MIYIKSSKLRHYKILTLNENDSFVIDLEGNIMNTIFPALLWSYPQKVYKISNEQAFELELRKKKIEIPPLLFIGIIIMSSNLFESNMHIINKLAFKTSFQFSVIILLFFFIACIFAKLYSYNKNKKRLSNIINLNECKPVKIKLVEGKGYVKTRIKLICFCIFLLLIVLLTILLYLETENFVILGTYIFFTYGYLASITVITPPMNIKDIKIIK